jgi:hypothetical protein
MYAVSVHCDAAACWFVRDVNGALVLCYYALGWCWAYMEAMGSVNIVATIDVITLVDKVETTAKKSSSLNSFLHSNLKSAQGHFSIRRCSLVVNYNEEIFPVVSTKLNFHSNNIII